MGSRATQLRLLKPNVYCVLTVILGVKSGQTYNFDTVITGGGSSVTLKQSMTGTWSGSDIKHSASGSDFSAPWFNDRNVQRFNTNYARKSGADCF